MTTPELAKCECGQPGFPKTYNDYHWVACGWCSAKTPTFTTPQLAAAAWNRMMIEPLHEIATRCGPHEGAANLMEKQDVWADMRHSDARTLLSALADELTNRADALMKVNEDSPVPMAALAVSVAIDKVLAKIK
jgi:hypothetical protein